MFNDDWATSHLNTKALFAAIGLTVVLVWSLFMKHQQDSRTLLRTEQIMATISDIKVTTKENTGRYNTGTQTTYFVQLELPNKKHLKFMMSQKPPKVGTKVPVNAEIYEDGNNYYSYERMEWALLGN